ncbi:MAG: hypothetical protein EAZ14_10075 [Runella slithyformis]|nr:MAG: hypothetical protein EAZ14_10075 [Runella slithyformis]
MNFKTNLSESTFFEEQFKSTFAMKKLILFAFLLVSVASCKPKDVAPSVPEQIEQFISNRRITRVIAAETLNDFFILVRQDKLGTSFKIDENFIVIDGVTWNLNHVKSYQVVEISGNNFVLWLKIN